LPIDARTDVFAVGIILWELLAGRRLFMGDTDLETVRMVQAARVPPIKQFNPNVGDRLERVLAKALAGDPKQRYQTARELGSDLNQVLFHLGRSVSSFDIAQLVIPIWRDRMARKRAQTGRGANIGSLIDQALFEFTSLPTGERMSGPQQGSIPLSLASFDNVPDWGAGLGLGRGDTGSEPPTSGSFELGNLAALEDEEEIPKPVRAPTPPGSWQATPAPPPVAPPMAPPAQKLPSLPPPHPTSGGKGGLITLIVFLAVAAGLAGAYFGGVIPH
jgi:serine/threonine-protein kinase